MRYRFESGGQLYEVSIERQGESYRATINGEPFEFEVLDEQPGQLNLRWNGKPVTLYWATDRDQKWVSMTGCTYRLEKPAPRQTQSAGDGSGNEAVRAPMPAQVRAIQVSEGDPVEKGQSLMLLEAMKMEIQIKAPEPGTVARLLVQNGQAVEKDQLLVEIGA